MTKDVEIVKARHPLDKQHIKLTYVTHFYCNQGNMDSVDSLLKEYESYPDDIKDAVEFVIVDDCSPLEYEVKDYDLNFTWLRITTDIQWNQAGSRNLGVTYAKSDKIIITDLDCLLPEDTMRYLVNARNPGRSLYRIYRTDETTGKAYRGHPNLFFMSRARFFRLYGYDEEFAGHYGSEDYRFVKFHKDHGSTPRYLPKQYRCIERNVDRKKSYHSLDRDLTHNAPIDDRKKNEIALFGAEYGHSRIFLNFNWEIKKVHSRPPTVPERKVWWRPLWWFRYLFRSLAA
ncbi:glycosyltransferase [Yersinia proxima]|uniref:Glycosyltransferase family 2 protein n=1 Tax=Yersinia proxima TaxID=2890316 RepID=A0ABW9ETH4_9GAMM|nr:glycosyltransferase family 2 protein [Yersinia proxima]CNL42906.1 Glycosyl transferase family 2 [Yersinia intermedia]